MPCSANSTLMQAVARKESAKWYEGRFLLFDGGLICQVWRWQWRDPSSCSNATASAKTHLVLSARPTNS